MENILYDVISTELKKYPDANLEAPAAIDSITKSIVGVILKKLNDKDIIIDKLNIYDRLFNLLYINTIIKYLGHYRLKKHIHAKNIVKYDATHNITNECIVKGYIVYSSTLQHYIITEKGIKFYNINIWGNNDG